MQQRLKLAPDVPASGDLPNKSWRTNHVSFSAMQVGPTPSLILIVGFASSGMLLGVGSATTAGAYCRSNSCALQTHSARY